MFKHPTLKQVLWIDVITRSLWHFFYIFFGVYTAIYCMQHINETKFAFLTALATGLNALMVIFIVIPKLRKWSLLNTWKMAILGAIIDGATEILILVNPFIKMICDTLGKSIWSKIWQIQCQERQNTILNTDILRTQMQNRLSVATYSAGLLGSSLAWFCGDIDILYIAIGSSITSIITYFTSGYRFVIADRYAKDHNLVYPSLRCGNRILI